VLKAKAFNLNIGFFYSSLSDFNEEYGRRRSASPKSYVVTYGSGVGGDGPGGGSGGEVPPAGNAAMVVKGDRSKYVYDEVGSSSGVTTYSAGCTTKYGYSFAGSPSTSPLRT
jgi:hypothetical protein